MAQIILLTDNRNVVYAYDINENIEYIGSAHPGALISEAKWQIRKLIYDDKKNIIAQSYANGEISYDKLWYGKTSYTYLDVI